MTEAQLREEAARLTERNRHLLQHVRELEAKLDRRLPNWRRPTDRRPHDRLGRLVPHRMHIGTLLGAINGAQERIRRVPARAIVELREQEAGDTALLDCPCGAHPVATEALEKCVGCERYYVLSGARPYVVYGDMSVPG